jgi:hypothetical protein
VDEIVMFKPLTLPERQPDDSRAEAALLAAPDALARGDRIESAGSEA